MLSPADVIREPDFSIGRLRVSPSARTVTSADEIISLEPRVMQVLLLLARQPNKVVTRDTLFAEVWGGVIVGDDSLNRAVAGVRRVVALDSTGLSLDTIPRTGYRLSLVGDGMGSGARHSGRALLSRRVAFGGAAAVAAVGGLGLWAKRAANGREYGALIARSKDAFHYGDPSTNPAQLLKKAVALCPDCGEAQGLLAYALALQIGNAFRLADTRFEPQAGTTLPAAERAARTALDLDPKQPFARLSLAFIHQASMDLVATEDLLRSILATSPGNVDVMKNLWNLLQCVGRSREALAMVQQALDVAPAAASVHYPLAQLLWITGQPAEADRVIDQAVRTWPKHRFVRYARFIILAFTGRPRVAASMLEDRSLAPQNFSGKSVALWRVSLEALDKPTPSAVAAARKANLETARSDLTLINQAVMVLSALGDIDGAFELTNAMFVVPDSVAGKSVSPRRPSSAAWRFAPWLFIPPLAPMHGDPRFAALCDTIGLTAYWETRGIRPDYRVA